MGYTPDNSLWLSLRGGDVYFNNGGVSDQFDQAKLGSRGFGILDVGYAFHAYSVHRKQISACEMTGIWQPIMVENQ